jgi:YVTN family beta-propeller protein
MKKCTYFITAILCLVSAVVMFNYVGCGGGGGGGGSSGSSSGTFSVVTNPATNITQTSVRLNGTVNPAGVNSTIYFQWGINTNYGNVMGYQIVGSGNNNLDVFANLTGLTLNSRYNYRMVCSRNGQTINGENKIFKTHGINTSVPVLSAIGNKIADKNTSLTFTLSATDGDVADTLTYSSPDLPAGATLNSATGEFSWLTPNLDMNYDVTFVVSDDGYPVYSDSETITISVGNVDHAPLLTSPGDKSVDENQLLTFTLSATDPDLDSITYSMAPTPQGATLDSNTGLFNWTPTYEQSGIYVITFTATANALSNSKKINITVNNINRAPVLTSIGDKNVNEGQLLSFTVSAADPDSNVIAYTMTPTITGVVLNSSNGSFLWTPSYNQAGVYNATFTATDNGIPNLSDSEAITITVQDVSVSPTCNTNPANNITAISATLNGTVNPNGLSTIAYFDYGITNTYGITTTNQSVGVGTADVVISATITGLSPTTTYYFRVVATNSAGKTNGNNQTFTTIVVPAVDDYVWVANYSSDTVTRIKRLDSATTTITVGTGPCGVGVDETYVWVSNEGSNSVTRIKKLDLTTNTIPVGAAPYGLAVDETSVWVVSESANNITRIQKSNLNTTTIPVATSYWHGITVDGAYVWMTNYDTGIVNRIQKSNTAISNTIRVGTNPYGLALDETYVWVANEGSNNVSRILKSNTAISTTITVGNAPAGVALDGTYCWVANGASNTATRILKSDLSTTTITAGINPQGIAVDGIYAWVANTGDGTVTRILKSNSTTTTITVGSAPYSMGDMTGYAYDNYARVP